MVVVEEVVDELLVELVLVGQPVTSFAFPLVDVRIVDVKHTP